MTGWWPAKAHTSASSVDCGRRKFVSSASTTRKRKPGGKRRVEPGPARSAPLSDAASSVRTTVVDGDDAAAAGVGRLNRRDGGLRDDAVFLVHLVSVEPLGAHGLEGARADEERHDARCTPRSSSAPRRSSSKCSPAVGVSPRRGLREHGLVVLCVFGLVGLTQSASPHDVGRQ